MSHKLPVNNFDWIKGTFQFNKYFIKSYNEGYFLEFDVQYTEINNDLPFLP